ncbi:J domain-containing protein [Enterococcus sp. BWB1-3]|uniref:J domain-containing protein n=1 Tax=Enterococcus sp. BWB1-3 TaxID=2787713 RepID=UPI001923C233|nr:DnaJ domain-containing protein [Enterococcus sp. BWB1-3]MBL1230516.1 J domain-containing protein [Enterococcus sp. BWB1-3]
MNHYQILNLSPQASQDEIKQQYRKLAKKLHPDRNPDDREAEKKFLQISEAYQVLGDEEKRKTYDQQLLRSGKSSHSSAAEQKTASQTAAGFSGTDKESLFQAAANFEQFFGFKENGRKINKNSSEKMSDASMLFEQYFTGKKKG